MDKKIILKNFPIKQWRQTFVSKRTTDGLFDPALSSLYKTDRNKTENFSGNSQVNLTLAKLTPLEKKVILSHSVERLSRPASLPNSQKTTRSSTPLSRRPYCTLKLPVEEFDAFNTTAASIPDQIPSNKKSKIRVNLKSRNKDFI